MRTGLLWRDILAFALGVLIGALLVVVGTPALKLRPIELFSVLLGAVALVLGLLAHQESRETNRLVNDMRRELREAGTRVENIQAWINALRPGEIAMLMPGTFRPRYR